MFIVPFYFLGFGSILAGLGLIWEILDDCKRYFGRPNIYIPETSVKPVWPNENYIWSNFSIL